MTSFAIIEFHGGPKDGARIGVPPRLISAVYRVPGIPSTEGLALTEVEDALHEHVLSVHLYRVLPPSQAVSDGKTVHVATYEGVEKG